MKTPLLFIAAFAAFVLLPVDFITVFIAMFVAGFACIVVLDYRRARRPLPCYSCAVPAGARRLRELPLAA